MHQSHISKRQKYEHRSTSFFVALGVVAGRGSVTPEQATRRYETAQHVTPRMYALEEAGVAGGSFINISVVSTG